MKMKFVISIVLILVSFINAQEQSNTTVKKILGEAVYYNDFLSYYSDRPGYTRLDVFIQVPYKSIQFIKSPEGFIGKYSVTASIFDSSKSRIVVEKTWNESITISDFSLATSRENFNVSKRSFELKPGSYVIRTAMEDMDSKKLTTAENNFVIRDLTDSISLSDILMIAKPDPNQAPNTIIPNIMRNVYSSKDRIRFYYEINSLDSVEVRKTIEYVVKNSDDKVIHREEEDRNIKPGINQVLYTLKEFPFDLGAFYLTVSVLNEGNKVVASVSKSFYSQTKGLASFITDIDKAIAQTVYIASASEMSYMTEGENQSERTKRFLEFWKKKDPSPNNEENEVFNEYFRRVAFSNENFSNYIEGWKTDRGMVFIILGAPNNIDRHPFEYDSKPYEVWEYYNLNRSFIFLDQTGFGDYRLITPLTGDLYRYRY